MIAYFYTPDNTPEGCYGDGALGHQHVRERLAEYASSLLDDAQPLLKSYDASMLLGVIEDLHEPMSDDASEEEAALEFLNDHSYRVFWCFYEGSLIAEHDLDD